jgi:hypothetical protein
MAPPFQCAGETEREGEGETQICNENSIVEISDVEEVKIGLNFTLWDLRLKT